jgi:hypothetical protein
MAGLSLPPLDFITFGWLWFSKLATALVFPFRLANEGDEQEQGREKIVTVADFLPLIRNIPTDKYKIISDGINKTGLDIPLCNCNSPSQYYSLHKASPNCKLYLKIYIYLVYSKRNDSFENSLRSLYFNGVFFRKEIFLLNIYDHIFQFFFDSAIDEIFVNGCVSALSRETVEPWKTIVASSNEC